MIGLFILINGIAVSITKSWNSDHIIALVLGNLLLVAAYFYFIGIFRLSKKLFAPKNEMEIIDESVSKIESKSFLLTDLSVKKYYQISFWAVALVTFILPFLFMIHVPDSKHAWDYFVIFNSTTELHGQSFGLLPETASRLGYFLRYPNNQFLGILFNQIFSPFVENVLLKMWVVTAVSALLTSLGVLAGTLSVKALSGKRHAILYNVCALGFLPFYVYGAQLYSDTITLPFVSFGLLFFIYAIKSDKLNRQILWYFLATLLTVLGYEFKPTVLIVLIAALVFLGLNKKWKQLLLLIPMFALLFVGGHFMVKATIATEPAFSQEANERHNLPMMHWIAMSWAPSNKTGGFNKKIRQYSESFPTYEAKKEADKQLFIDNIKKMGPAGIVRQIGRKLSYTWLYGDLNSSFYTYYHENKFINRYFDYLSGTSLTSLDGPGNITGWFMLKAVQTLYWIGLVVLLWRQIWRILSRKKNWSNPWFVPALAFVGLSFFLILWETNSRYLYQFAPVMIALASLGLIDNQFKKKKRVKE
ncbi:glycosyltransferase family 39 protein [Lactococcus cremoris]|uniref:glycosyltransferase family 39 protein n=1 Tax=Lactococcus lactis subsp. cremoris TaxID=1359 RepID=UPI000C7A3341